jgi:small multidrug resistance pump
MIGWALLGLAVSCELVATMALRHASSNPAVWAYALAAVGYVAATVLLLFTLRYLPVGITYAVWAGLGTVGTAVGAALLFDERLSGTAMAGIAVVIVGTTLTHLGASTSG